MRNSNFPVEKEISGIQRTVREGCIINPDKFHVHEYGCCEESWHVTNVRNEIQRECQTVHYECV